MTAWTTPALDACQPGIEPTEYQVLVAMAELPEKTTGGIIMPSATHEKESWGSDHARIVAVSPLAFTYANNWPERAKPSIGDVVFVGRYPGTEVTGRDGRKYKLVSDREIAAVIERAPQAESEHG